MAAESAVNRAAMATAAKQVEDAVTQVINALQEFYPKLTTTRSRYEANEQALTSASNRVAGQINR